MLLVVLASGLWSSNALSLSLASSTFSDLCRETQAVSLAFINALSNLAQIYGAYLSLAADRPKAKDIMGFAVISAMLLGRDLWTSALLTRETGVGLVVSSQHERPKQGFREY